MHHHTTFHDPVLVALSILIAALASYTALDLATRMRAASGRARRAWLAAAAIAMGGGIWSMHFVGMLAFSLPGIEISYDPFLTLLSLVIPIVVAAAAFAVVGRRPQALLASGFAMGLGISGMHYTGMSAMRMAASIEYDPRWVVLSIVIAISASVVALWLAFRHTNAVQRLFAGLVMGLAISGMHYAAMEGASFLPGDLHRRARRTSRRRSGTARVPARRHHHRDPEHRDRRCRLRSGIRGARPTRSQRTEAQRRTLSAPRGGHRRSRDLHARAGWARGKLESRRTPADGLWRRYRRDKLRDLSYRGRSRGRSARARSAGGRAGGEVRNRRLARAQGRQPLLGRGNDRRGTERKRRDHRFCQDRAGCQRKETGTGSTGSGARSADDVAEDGDHRSADRRRRPRFQQSARRRSRQSRALEEAPASGRSEDPASRGQRDARRAAGRLSDPAHARFRP